jgi:hypothetical protein
VVFDVVDLVPDPGDGEQVYDVSADLEAKALRRTSSRSHGAGAAGRVDRARSTGNDALGSLGSAAGSATTSIRHARPASCVMTR